jgi:hypothetical protein
MLCNDIQFRITSFFALIIVNHHIEDPSCQLKSLSLAILMETFNLIYLLLRMLQSIKLDLPLDRIDSIGSHRDILSGKELAWMAIKEDRLSH